MTPDQERLLWGDLSRVAEATNRRLRRKESHCFVNLYNDWLDLVGGTLAAYPGDEALSSLVAADLLSLGKEILWMHRLLHWGCYPLVHRNLRYVWELVCLAHFADTLEVSVPEITDPPGETVDAKAAWLKNHDRRINWRSVIRPIVDRVIDREERRHYSQLWGGPNRTVHASHELRERMMGESGLAVKDAFGLKWAKETCASAAAVLDVIWLIVLRRFPKIIPLLHDTRRFLSTPRCRKVVAG
jgi:hypothetical protein